jgi:uncharacterized protein RhaS with RHS repeats
MTKTTVNGTETTYTYNSLGHLVNEMGEFVKVYFYEGDSVKSTIIGINNSIMYSNTQNVYDSEMRLQQVKDGTTVIATYTYDAKTETELY